ncbi:MAG: chemotaxis protein CheW [Moraxellaceae bacterium]|nr:chemotaxis protein CheW [Moraxellaceae bacterium]
MSTTTSWLALRCGAVRLLLPADRVEAVGFVADVDAVDGHWSWRGRLLPVQDFCLRLGQGGPATQWVVVASDDRACVVTVDEVIGLREIAPIDWQPFTAVTAEAASHFDSVLADAHGSLLRLRQPFAFL